MGGQRTLKSDQVRKLIGFVGYGPKHQVKILFLGYEERAPKGKKEYYNNISARMNFKPIMDLKEAHDRLGKAGCRNPFDCDGKNPVKVWNCAARFALEFENRRHGPKPKMLWSEYWRKSLGQKMGNTFLMECDPIPKWNHRGKNKLPQEWDGEEIWNERKDALAKALNDLKPQFVIAYGAETKAKVQELFGVDKDGWQKRQKGKHQISFASKRRAHIAHIGFPGRGFAYTDGIPCVVRELVKEDKSRSRRRRQS